jgi:hypothetical protein
MSDATHTHTAVRPITKTVRIGCDPQTAFEFLANVGNWPRWAVVNVKSPRRTDDPDWWDMVTPHGTARLRMRADAHHGILDRDFVDPQANWTVPARGGPQRQWGGIHDYVLPAVRLHGRLLWRADRVGRRRVGETQRAARGRVVGADLDT